MNTLQRRIYIYGIVVEILLGIIMRITYCLSYPVQPRDAYTYEQMIENWEKYGEFVDKLHFYPLSLWILKAPNHYFSFEIVKGGIIVNFLLGIYLIYLFVAYFKKIFKKTYIALFSGLIVATHPTLIHFSCSFLRENTYLFFSGIAIGKIIDYCFMKKFNNIVLCGVFVSLSFLCRLEGLELIIFAPLIIIHLAVQKRIGPLKAITHIICFLGVAFSTTIIVCQILNLDIIELRRIFDPLDFDYAWRIK